MPCQSGISMSHLKLSTAKETTVSLHGINRFSRIFLTGARGTAAETHVRFQPESAGGMVYSRLMRLDPDTCYDALLSRNRRFDGWFFVGVATTGVLPPRLPGEAAESAELQLLPERRGRRESRLSTLHALPPRLAPGHGLLDLSGTLADAAATLIEDGFLNAHSVDALARRVGVTERHLRRIFGAQFGVAGRVRADAQVADGQAVADRYRAAGGRRRVHGRVRQRAALQRPVPAAVRPQSTPAAQRPARRPMAT